MYRLCSYRTLCSIRVLSWLLVLNVLVLGVCLVFVFRGKPAQRNTHDGSAFEHWKRMRDKWVEDNPNNIVVGSNGKNDETVFRNDDERADLEGLSLQADSPIAFIPQVPKFSISDVVPFLMPNITSQYLALPEKKYTEHVVILTPTCDVAGHLSRFGRLLSALTYPHDLISIYFGEDSSSDATFEIAKETAADLHVNFGFRNAHAFKLNISGGVHGGWGDSHDQSVQHERRSHIAKARNLLLSMALRDEDWVLWIDSDVTNLPPDLVQQLLFGRKDVTAAACVFMHGNYKRNYDKNSWRETEMSLADLRRLPPDVLVVEGYSDTKRLFLPDLRAEGRIVPLDGVGGCALLINATCHRMGLEFPEKLYKNHLETEGLGKMANHMNFSVVGMPFLEVFH